jgi:hypothetical protein
MFVVGSGTPRMGWMSFPPSSFTWLVYRPSDNDRR